LLSKIIQLLKQYFSKKESTHKEYEKIRVLENTKIVKVEYLIDGIEYNSQRDNKINPLVACSVTSLQMFMQFMFSSSCPTDDELMRHCNSDKMQEWAKKHIGSWTLDFSNKGRLNQVHAVLAKTVNDFANAEVAFATSGLTIEKIKDEIKRGYPLVLGGKFTRGGHMVTCVGFNPKGLIINDPFGDWNNVYKNHNGEHVVYEFEKMKNVLSGNGIIYR